MNGVVAAWLTTAASALFESTPFLLAGAALAALPLPWAARAVPYLGCGCGAGPSARSLPAAAAACALFGPWVAIARLASAAIVDRLAPRAGECGQGASPLQALHGLIPIAMLGAGFPLLLSAAGEMHTAPLQSFAAGAAAAFVVAPCGIGSIALAAAMRSALPWAAAGFLSVAGICDLRTWLPGHHHGARHDAFAYALLAAACLLVAARGGSGVVHPRIAAALWVCGAAFAALAFAHRHRQTTVLRIAPAMMLAGAVLGAPPAQYHATQTSIADAFAGENIDFTGVATQTGNATTLVRYAITCCRADAAPVVVRLEKPRSLRGWVHAAGVLVEADDGLRLRVRSLEAVAAPADPFVYR